MRRIIDLSRESAYQAVNFALARRNWLLGRRIAEEEFNCAHRAEYGLEIIKKLSKSLTEEYGKDFTKTNLYNFYLFYKVFPKILQTASGKSYSILSWSHYSRTRMGISEGTPSLVGKPFQRLAPLVTKSLLPSFS